MRCTSSSSVPLIIGHNVFITGRKSECRSKFTNVHLSRLAQLTCIWEVPSLIGRSSSKTGLIHPCSFRVLFAYPFNYSAYQARYQPGSIHLRSSSHSPNASNAHIECIHRMNILNAYIEWTYTVYIIHRTHDQTGPNDSLVTRPSIGRTDLAKTPTS